MRPIVSSSQTRVLGKPDGPATTVVMNTTTPTKSKNDKSRRQVTFKDDVVDGYRNVGHMNSTSTTSSSSTLNQSFLLPKQFRTFYVVSLVLTALIAMPFAYYAGFNSAIRTNLYNMGVAKIPDIEIIGDYYHDALKGMFPDGIPQWPLDINLIVITRHQNKDDYRGFHAIKAVFPRAEQTWGIDPLTWPKHIDEAEHAVKAIRELNAKNFKDLNKITQSKDTFWDERRSADNLVGIPWIDAIDLREPDSGALAKEKVGLSHHIGCLFAHMKAWQQLKDLQMNKAWVMEADGLMKMQEFSNIPLWAMTSVSQNLPEDADFVLLHKGMDKFCGVDGSLCAMHSTFLASNLFDPSDKKMLAFRHWPVEGTEAGLQTYIVSDRFVEKMQDFLALHGSDMIDAYLYGNLCQMEYKNEQERDKIWAMNYMSAHAQRQPTSSGNDRGLKILNCYIVTPA